MVARKNSAPKKPAVTITELRAHVSLVYRRKKKWNCLVKADSIKLQWPEMSLTTELLLQFRR